jgi:hypothetical protein
VAKDAALDVSHHARRVPAEARKCRGVGDEGRRTGLVEEVLHATLQRLD